MSGTVDTLVEMGFSRKRAQLAVTKTRSDDIQQAMDWLLAHENDPEEDETSTEQQPQNQQSSEAPQSEGEVKSIKCEDCGKLFQTQAEVEFHATKSGHENFAESTEEKKPLSEVEKKEKLQQIEAKLRQRRLEREAREKEEALEKERMRIKSGKEMLEAKKKYDDLEMKKIAEQRKREKEEERLAKQRVRDQIEQDKLARKAKFSGETPKEIPSSTPQSPAQSSAASKKDYTDVIIQIRLTNGSSLTQKFGGKEPLSAVRVFVEMNRKDDIGAFNLMTTHPRKVFGPEDYEAPLETLGLGPRAILHVCKT